MDAVDELAEALKAEVFIRSGKVVPASLVYPALAKVVAIFLASNSETDRSRNALLFMREVATRTEQALEHT